MGYAPFLIAPFGTGLDTDQEPWLLPLDAFTEIVNGHIHHGFVEKREGFRFLAEMTHGQPISGATNADPAVFTIASTAALTTGDSVTLQYLSGGTWNTLSGEIYTITVLSGTTFSLADSSNVAVDGTTLGAYSANSGRLGTFESLRIMGIFRYIDASNLRQTLVADTRRVSLYNTASELLEPLDLFDISSTLRTDSDVFSSTDLDYIWEANWQHAGSVNRVYFTNGKAYQSGTPGTDGILFYDAQNPRVEQFQPSLNATDDLYGCKLLFSLRQRLVCLHTFEFNGSSTNTFPQRARWCARQDPSRWIDSVAGGGGFVDAPTGEQIISATQLQDIIIVHFTDSVWTLRPVPNPQLPFRWDKINSFRACDGKMASTGFDRYSVGLGVRGITATDGVETRRIDQRIEDFSTNEINSAEFGKVFGERSYAKRRTWFLYPMGTGGSEDADSALIYDDESGAYSTYRIDLNVLGHGSVVKDLAAQDFIEKNGLDKSAEDFDDETAFSFFWDENAEIFLGGDRSGKIYILETGVDDDGEDIDFSLSSAAWNPFKEEGVEAQMGYIDFFVSSDQQTNISIEFFKDNSFTPYASQGLDFLPNLGYQSSIANVTVNSDPSTGFVVTSNSHGLSAGNKIYFYGIDGAGWLNDRQWDVGTPSENTFTVEEDITSFGDAITGISQANPAVVTSVAHNLSNGDVITIVDVSGMTEVNDLIFTVSSATTDTFSLEGIDSTAFTAYTSGGYAFLSYTAGGKIFERKFFKTKVWKRAYAGGIGYNHHIKLEASGAGNPLKIHAFKPWFRKRGRRTLG